VRYDERWSEPPTSAKAVAPSTMAAIDTREMVLVLGWKICGIDREPRRRPPCSRFGKIGVASGPHAGPPLSRHLRVGHGHRRPPGRRRQLEQRLVDVGARSDLALPGTERRRVRSLASLPRGHPAARRARLQRLPLLARVEPDRARGGGVLAC